MADEIVCDALVFSVWDGLVVVVALRVTGNDIPGMQQTREIAERTQEDVDEGVG
jgi:hypothetical protein